MAPLSAVLAAVTCVIPEVRTLDNGLALTPYLGWSTYNFYGNYPTENIVLEMADAIVSSGLRDLGFDHVHVDGGYLIHDRDAQGRLQVNTTRFPSGIRALSDSLHARGLKIGVYTDIGNVSCGNGPGSFGHFEQDAHMFAHEWQVDALKVDMCDFWFIPGQLKLWQDLRDALNRTGRPIYLFSTPHSGGPHSKVPAHGVTAPWHHSHPYAPPSEWNASTRRSLANSMMVQFVNLFDYYYRPHWGSATSPPSGFLTNVDAFVALSRGDDGEDFSGPGAWADAQQLEVCNFGEGRREFNGQPGWKLGMTLEEYRAQYSLWAVFASPLVLTFDVRTLPKRHPECWAMVINKKLLAIATDVLGRPGILAHQLTNATDPTDANLTRTDNIVEQIWSRQLSGGARVVCMFNRDETPRVMSFTWKQAKISGGSRVKVNDVWDGTPGAANYTTSRLGVSALVPSHSVALLELTWHASPALESLSV